ncbi:MAG: hypothetical protein ACRD1R_12830 [Acidobacteriota bacterium]
MGRQWPCVILLLVTAAVYMNSFPGAFHFDDFPLLLDNPEIYQENFRYGAFLEQYGGRPLTLWTFHLNYQFFGRDPFSYHLVSVLLHGLATVMLYFFALRLFPSVPTAFAAALIFSLHPLQTQAVNYIWSRSEILMTCFALAALMSIQKRSWLALIFFQLAIWSRTDALVLAPLLIYLAPRQWKLISSLALLNVSAFVYSMLEYAPGEMAWNYRDAGGYWLAQPQIFWKYILMMIWPSGLSIDHDFTPLGWPVSLISALLMAGLLVLLARYRREQPVFVFGGLWLALALVPSLLIPNPDWINESRLYPALAGFALAAAFAAGSIRPAWPRFARLALPLAFVLLALPLTLARNELWQNDPSLWKDAASKYPNKSRIHYNLGVALAHEGKTALAQKEFNLASDLNPGDDLSYAALAYCSEIMGKHNRARQLYERALHINPENEYAREGMARTAAKQEVFIEVY